MTALAIENASQKLMANVVSVYEANKKVIWMVVGVLALMTVSMGVFAAATTDTWANAGYDFVYGAATGKFTRAICIVGGIVAIMSAAGSGRYVLALGGVVLAIFGFLSPTLVNAIFGTALI